MAYRLMLTLINSYLAGSTKYSQEQLDTKLDVYYGADRLTEEQYTELHNLLHSKDVE